MASAVELIRMKQMLRTLLGVAIIALMKRNDALIHTIHICRVSGNKGQTKTVHKEKQNMVAQEI
jgi:hypothetical protein